MMKSIFTPKEDQPDPTGFKFLGPIFQVQVLDSVAPKKTLTFSLRPFHSCSALCPDSTDKILQLFCTMP